MFIRSKGLSFYLVENHRENGKVRQKILASLGREKTIPDAIEALKKYAAEWRNEAKEIADSRSERFVDLGQDHWWHVWNGGTRNQNRYPPRYDYDHSVRDALQKKFGDDWEHARALEAEAKTLERLLKQKEA